MMKKGWSFVVACVVLSCASSQAPPPSTSPGVETSPGRPEEASGETVTPNDDVVALYQELDSSRHEYLMALDLFLVGEEAVGEEQTLAALERLRRITRECLETVGCEVERFFQVYDELLGQNGLHLKRQTAQLNDLAPALEEEREPGTSSFATSIPELERTQSLLRGTDLREMITLNGPVKAALDDWLTWMRPLLMDAYENYQFLRGQIAPIYEAAGFPEALLFAIIATETGGRVHSFSRAGAAGPLQFMPYTGRRYGLREVDGFDQRLDPAAATRASVAYFNDQFKILNDNLEKALAAYNGGETRVRSLHRRLGGASFWDNRFYYSLPRETREYVPRIFAAAWLFLHPEEHGLEFPQLQVEVVGLELAAEMALDELALCLGQAAGQDNGWFRTLRNLNPRLDPGERVKPGESIVVPAILAEEYALRCTETESLAWIRELHDANYPGDGEVIFYTVRRGDTLGRIASRFSCTSIRELGALNRLRPPSYVIRIGQRLRIPRCS